MAFRLVMIGASLGGMRALPAVLGNLRANFPVPVSVTLHRAADMKESEILTQYLQGGCRLKVIEVGDKTRILPGNVYLSPADYHVLIEDDHFALSIDEPVEYARPSIDVAFQSAAKEYGPEVVGVLLTGTGRDGADGIATIKRCGGLTIVQTPQTAERGEMPRAALAATAVDEVLPLEMIAGLLNDRCSVTS